MDALHYLALSDNKLIKVVDINDECDQFCHYCMLNLLFLACSLELGKRRLYQSLCLSAVYSEDSTGSRSQTRSGRSIVTVNRKWFNKLTNCSPSSTWQLDFCQQYLHQDSTHKALKPRQVTDKDQSLDATKLLTSADSFPLVEQLIDITRLLMVNSEQLITFIHVCMMSVIMTISLPLSLSHNPFPLHN